MYYSVKKISAFILLVILCGCGYRFVGGGTLPAGTGTVFVRIFENRSGDSMLGTRVASDIVYELTRNGQKTVNKPEAADSVLSGKVISVSSVSSTRSSALTSVEKKLRVLFSAELKAKDGEVIWKNSDMKYEQLYAAEDMKEDELANRAEALEKISETFAEALFVLMSQDF